MNFYIAIDPETGRRIWGKRQDDAKKIDRDFEKRDVDTSQDGLILVFQAYEDRILELIGGSAPAEAPEEPQEQVEVQVPVPASQEPPPVRHASIEEQILAADGNEFGRIFQATIERLGELRGAGWNALRSLISNHPRSRTSIERGLGYLLLEHRSLASSETAEEPVEAKD